MAHLIIFSLFTKQGSIQFGAVEKNDGITFFVKDTGIGIKQEHQEKVFERFSRVLAPDDKENLYSGTGIGLSLSKEIVELLEGEMWIESEFGVGSNFYFYIPRVRRDFLLN